MVPMRDGARMNTFVYLPDDGGRLPGILHRTPYGIAPRKGASSTSARAGYRTRRTAARSDPAGLEAITGHGYAAVYQDCRGRHGSEGEDHVYGDDAPDGYDTLEWIAAQPWSNQPVGLSGASAGATTTSPAASTRHPSVRRSSPRSAARASTTMSSTRAIHRDGAALAMGRPTTSPAFRPCIARRSCAGLGLDAERARRHRRSARPAIKAWTAPATARPPYLDCEEWLHLPLAATRTSRYGSRISTRSSAIPCPTISAARHDFRSTIDVPGFHVTCWYDIFLTSVIAAFQEIQARVGTSGCGSGRTRTTSSTRFLAARPLFRVVRPLAARSIDADRGAPGIYSPRAWAADRAAYRPDDWRHAETWPPPGVRQRRVTCAATARSARRRRGRPLLRLRPERPIPSLGGRNMTITAGARPAVGAGADGLRADLRGGPLSADVRSPATCA